MWSVYWPLSHRTEQGRVADVVSPVRHRRKADRDGVVAKLSVQYTDGRVRYRPRMPAEPAAPFLSVDDETGGIHGGYAAGARILALSYGEFRRGEPITPANVIPVIDMER